MPTKRAPVPLPCTGAYSSSTSLWKGLELLNPSIKEPVRRCVYRVARITYRRRKPSVELVFAHLKDLTGLTGEHQLPYRGLARVSSYLLVVSCLGQLMMYDNYVNQRGLGCMQTFRTTFQ